MALGDNLFKLEKLKITAYKTIERKPGDSTGEFEAMFNPESLTQSYEILYGKPQAMGTSNKPQRYANNLPSDLSLSLVLDGSGTADMGMARLGPRETVSKRVDKFLRVAFDMDGEIHEPHYLVLTWGDLEVRCRLGSFSVRYTHFDRGGNPLRADLDIRLISDENPGDLQKKEKKQSPDLSHSRVVKTGDTLPLLSKEVYGSSAHYLWVAEQNGLDEIRRLTPGQRLVFPPLPPAARR